MTMGTASTVAALGEALGIALPGNGAIPAVDSRRLQLAEETGRVIVRLVEADCKPSRILTDAAFENAIRTLHTIGGSANAVIHLMAIAGRVGIDLPLARFDELARTTPMLVNLKPSGEYLMEDFYYAGGVPALLKELSPLLRPDAVSVTGKSLVENVAGASCWNREVIRPLDQPLHPEGGLAVLSGSLAPRGAIIKVTAATPALLQHRGRALVFENHDDMLSRIDAPDLDVRADDVLVLRNAGPLGAPGMPEWGFLPIPKKLLQAGVRDMVRISDARMSGTAFGTVVVHVAPEAAAGGPLAVVRTGDMIELDVAKRRLDMLVEDSEISRRLRDGQSPAPGVERGYGWLYQRHVRQADEGCDFDFLRRSPNMNHR
jgi:dihydroxy-acid dehydratase